MKKFVSQIIKRVQGKFEQDREKSIRSYRLSGTTVKDKLSPADSKNRYFHVYYSSRKAASEREELEQKAGNRMTFIRKCIPMG